MRSLPLALLLAVHCLSASPVVILEGGSIRDPERAPRFGFRVGHNVAGGFRQMDALQAGKVALGAASGCVPFAAEGTFSGSGFAARIRISGPDVGWWEVDLPLPYDARLDPASVAEGRVVLAVRGGSGGESVDVGLVDRALPRHSVRLPLGRYGPIATQWTLYRIPVADFLALAPSLLLDRLGSVQLFSARGAPVALDVDHVLLEPGPVPAGPAREVIEPPAAKPQSTTPQPAPPTAQPQPEQPGPTAPSPAPAPPAQPATAPRASTGSAGTPDAIPGPDSAPAPSDTQPSQPATAQPPATAPRTEPPAPTKPETAPPAPTPTKPEAAPRPAPNKPEVTPPTPAPTRPETAPPTPAPTRPETAPPTPAPTKPEATPPTPAPTKPEATPPTPPKPAPEGPAPEKPGTRPPVQGPPADLRPMLPVSFFFTTAPSGQAFWEASNLQSAFATNQGERALDAGETKEFFQVGEGGRLPLVTLDDPLRSGPVLMIKVKQAGFAWWVAAIGRANWETSDERPYVRNGRLEMAVKGAAGDEQLRFGLMDAKGQAAVVLLDHYAKVTTTWQTVRVPLRILKTGNPRLDWSRIRSAQVTSASGLPMTVWLSDIRIVNPPGGVE